MYKISNESTPEYINKMFSKDQESNANESHVLRSMTADNFLLPKSKTGLYTGSLAFSAQLNGVS